MALIILSLASFMAALDLFVVNVAFPEIGKDFRGEPLSNLSWVLNAYAIVFAALMVPLGRLADRHGRKGGFLLGLAIFTIGSAGCAAAGSLWFLVGFRVLQAAGAALLIPTSLGLLLSVFPPESRGGAVRVWSASSALAAAAGPVIGGLLVDISWRWVFTINLPVGALTAVAAAALVRRSPRDQATRTPDLLGAVSLTAGIGLTALALVEINDWPALRLVGIFALAAVAFGAFWLRTIRHPAPIVSPALLANRVFAWSNATALAFNAAFAAGLLAGVLWLQTIWRYSPLGTGLAVAPGALAVPPAAAVAAFLSSRLRLAVGQVTALGCVFAAVGTVLLTVNLGLSPGYAGDFLPGWLVYGCGVGLALPTILSTATEDLPPDQFATGSGVINMTRQIGSVLGISLVIAVIGTPRGYEDTHRAFEHVWITIGLLLVLGAATALGMSSRREQEVTAPSQAPVQG